MTRGVGHGARRRGDSRRAGGREGRERRVHAGGRDGVMIAIGGHGKAARRAALDDGWRLTVAVAVEAVTAVVDLDAGGGMARVLVDGVLHLAQEVVKLNEVLLGPGAGHRQIVLLRERVLRRGRAAVKHGRRGLMVLRLRHVLLRGSHGASAHGQRAVQRHEGASDLGIGAWVDLAALGVSEEVIDQVIRALAVVASGSAVGDILGAGGVHGGLVEVEAVAGGRLGRVVAMTLLREAAASDLVVVAGSLGAVGSVVKTAVVLLARAREDGVVGVRLDVLLQVLGALEALAAELTLVRLQRDVDPDVGGDVVTLDGGGAARIPLAGEAEVVCALAANMAVTDVLLEEMISARAGMTRLTRAKQKRRAKLT